MLNSIGLVDGRHRLLEGALSATSLVTTPAASTFLRLAVRASAQSSRLQLCGFDGRLRHRRLQLVRQPVVDIGVDAEAFGG